MLQEWTYMNLANCYSFEQGKSNIPQK